MYKVYEIKQRVFADNDLEADKVRTELKKDKTFLLNLMSSPGAGKTTTLTKTIDAMKHDFRIGVMEADIDSAVDADTISETGAKVIQLHTGGMCHLDADMTRQGLLELDTSDVDLAILENVGNLVCPAEFDTGAVKNAMILSVPEGDDKPLKYPLMFQVCQCLLINKIDVLPYFDFDLEECKKRVLKLNPDMKIIPISARTGEGMDEWIDWLKEETSSWNESNEKGVKEERKLILKLGQMITDRVGVKVTVEDPEYWGLAEVLTDEMAEVCLSMKVRKPMTLEQIARKSGKDPERVQKLLDEMSVIGMIEYNWENADHHKQYVLPMFVPGCAEFMMMNDKQVEEHPILADFFENMSRLWKRSHQWYRREAPESECMSFL